MLISVKPFTDRLYFSSYSFFELGPLLLIGVTLHANLFCAMVMSWGIIVIAQNAIKWLFKMIEALRHCTGIHYILASVAFAEWLMFKHHNMSLGLRKKWFLLVLGI